MECSKRIRSMVIMQEHYSQLHSVCFCKGRKHEADQELTLILPLPPTAGVLQANSSAQA